jgi:hypothetical protein
MDAPHTPAIAHVSAPEREAFVRMVATAALQSAMRQLAAEHDSPIDPLIEDCVVPEVPRRRAG